MIITLIKQHDKTRGPEAHQTYIFSLQSETAGDSHSPSIFDYKGEQYRAFRTYSQSKPIVANGKKYNVATVVAVKLADEIAWAKNGKQGKIDPKVLEGHIAR